MRTRSVLATLLLAATVAACASPAPGGGGESTAPNVAPSSAELPEASATPYTAPGDY